MQDHRGSALGRLLKTSTKIEAHEFGAALLSFGFVFVLMTAYFMLRPVRDAMASDWSDVEVSTLWSMTFLFSLVAVTLYGAVISKVHFRWLVSGVYAFFAASFFVFYFGSTYATDAVLVDKSFYVWLSVFSLFHDFQGFFFGNFLGKPLGRGVAGGFAEGKAV